jgi:hypothetical protein
VRVHKQSGILELLHRNSPKHSPHIPSSKSLDHFLLCLSSCKESIQVRDPVQHYAMYHFLRREDPPPQPHRWRTTPRQLSVTAYSIYSQRTSISGSIFLHPSHQETPCSGDKGLTQHGKLIYRVIRFVLFRKVHLLQLPGRRSSQNSNPGPWSSKGPPLTLWPLVGSCGDFHLKISSFF